MLRISEKQNVTLFEINAMLEGKNIFYSEILTFKISFGHIVPG